MKFEPNKIQGSFVITPTILADERGFFTEAWNKAKFEAQGLRADFKQGNISLNKTKGTLRGLHYQVAPHDEDKLVRVSRGAVFDVVVDLRPESPSYKKWEGVELTADNYKMLYIPKGCAHGYLTLVDNTEVCYEVSALFDAKASRGVLWNDKAFGIRWPQTDGLIISERDLAHPVFTA